jgi:hypothetical protein
MSGGQAPFFKTEAHMDFLFGLGQVLAIIGLLYGAYLAITYGHYDEGHYREVKPQFKPKAISAPTGYDALSSHVWSAPRAHLD